MSKFNYGKAKMPTGMGWMSEWNPELMKELREHREKEKKEKSKEPKSFAKITTTNME